MAIRTVFWDIGGVLLSNGFGRKQRAGLFDVLGLDEAERAEFEVRYPDANWHWERGLIDDVEYFQRTLFFKPREFTLADVWKGLKAQQALLYPSSVEILHALHGRNDLRQAALNNESRELNNYRIDHFGLRPYFDFCICSGYVGEMKPASGIYRSALEIGGDKPGEACFIDDKKENVEAANAAGLVGLHFTSPENLRVQLQTLGIDV